MAEIAQTNEHTYKFDVKMTCGGCSGAVTRALQKAQTNGSGISSYDVSLENQKVIVKGTEPYESVLEVIKKTGKQVLSGEVDPKEDVSAEDVPVKDAPVKDVPVEVAN